MEKVVCMVQNKRIETSTTVFIIKFASSDRSVQIDLIQKIDQFGSKIICDFTPHTNFLHTPMCARLRCMFVIYVHTLFTRHTPT